MPAKPVVHRGVGHRPDHGLQVLELADAMPEEYALARDSIYRMDHVDCSPVMFMNHLADANDLLDAAHATVKLSAS